MMITIHYMGQVKHAAGIESSQEVHLPGSCTVMECIRLLTTGRNNRLRHFLLDDNGQLSRTILLFARDEQVRHADQVWLRDQDELTILSPIAGG